jgi:hypothetical protein
VVLVYWISLLVLVLSARSRGITNAFKLHTTELADSIPRRGNALGGPEISQDHPSGGMPPDTTELASSIPRRGNAVGGPEISQDHPSGGMPPGAHPVDGPSQGQAPHQGQMYQPPDASAALPRYTSILSRLRSDPPPRYTSSPLDAAFG